VNRKQPFSGAINLSVANRHCFQSSSQATNLGPQYKIFMFQVHTTESEYSLRVLFKAMGILHSCGVRYSLNVDSLFVWIDKSLLGCLTIWLENTKQVGKESQAGNMLWNTLRCYWTCTGNILVPTGFVCCLEPVDILELANNLKILRYRLVSMHHHLIKK